MSDDALDIENDEAAAEEAQYSVFPWEGPQLDISEAMVERATIYANYINPRRAVPDVRDGLKEVHRRSLYAMNLAPARAGQKYVKSAQVVGKTMGEYHPHGDSAIYDAMVRMAQSFSMNAMLIDGKGNWGSIDGDPAAASRYTECRLSKASTDWMADLDDEIVPFAKNFDETRTEPTVLPATFPNLLVNGTQGIGWAIACSFPTHNLAEAVDAALAVADNPDVSVEKLLKKMPGPDFPTGAMVVNPEVLKDIYETGRGTCLLQAKYHIEQLSGGQQAVIVTEIPFQVQPGRVIQAAVKAAREEKITEIATAELPKDLSDSNGIRLQFKTKRGGNVQKLVEELMQNTPLRTTVQFNFTCLIDGYVRTVTLKEILQQFISFRQHVVTKRLEKERRDLHHQLRRLQALIAASDVIDKVVKIIRTSDDDDHARQQLTKLLKYRPHGSKKDAFIDDEQAQMILDMPLKRLNALNQFKLREEAKQKAQRIDEIDAILKSKTGVLEIVKQELKETKKAYGQPRKTELVGGMVAEGTKTRDVGVISGPAQDVMCYVTSKGTAALTELKRRAGSGIPINASEPTRLVAALKTKSDRQLIAFTAQGMCYRVGLADVPLSSRASAGRDLIPVGRGDSVVAVFEDSAPGEASMLQEYFVMATAQGELKRIHRDLVSKAHIGGVPAYGLNEGDAIVSVIGHGETAEVVFVSAKGQALRTAMDNIRAVQTGSAGGRKAMKLGSGDRVVQALGIENGADAFLVAHETGMAKRVELANISAKGLGGGGVRLALTDKPAKQAAGEVSFVSLVPKKGELTLYTDRAATLAINVAQVAVGAPAVVSKPTFDLLMGDQIAGIAPTSGE